MVVRTTATIPEYYDEGFLPWPWPEDEVPARLPIEIMQSPTIKQLIIILAHSLGPRAATTFVDTNIPLRFDPTNRRVFIAPDICVSFDVDLFAIRYEDTYDLWEIGKPPEFVLEVASPSTYRNDLYQKPEIYAYIGVEEYWMFDPTGGDLYGQALAGYRLVDGKYEPIGTDMNEHSVESGYSEALELRLCSVELSRQNEILAVQPDFVFMTDDFNPCQLLLQDPNTGLYLLNAEGVSRQYEMAEAQAERAEARVERVEAQVELAEAQAERAEARAERVEAQVELAEAQAERAEARAERAEAQMERAEAQIERTEAELDAERAENARLRERLRRMEGE